MPFVKINSTLATKLVYEFVSINHPHKTEFLDNYYWVSTERSPGF